MTIQMLSVTKGFFVDNKTANMEGWMEGMQWVASLFTNIAQFIYTNFEDAFNLLIKVEGTEQILTCESL